MRNVATLSFLLGLTVASAIPATAQEVCPIIGPCPGGGNNVAVSVDPGPDGGIAMKRDNGFIVVDRSGDGVLIECGIIGDIGEAARPCGPGGGGGK
jgi:hypothetical protein